ncbi:MAG: glucose-1-phosphate cytidylyltransferase [Candidatus Staskawiczbacteria bacterium CG10_big_fil_rev_8_21_14_0_10_38_10]|uniref:Glucose-1-phosphate cytidylyltransferase n=1 Tax=Candidatus Staskawiczbacteria bacterium CG10_big_fil_rev_8_21_14_0_10_38_10 TaxID=1974891 RepID=A0A2H9T1U0_9BACT|nr:MAG: glucose-1-phosphate cytidylyltransferase [Candidatus Staskawiczbacteria bacterium CG10_big_fil_rev_8_21_14_0_10_38_10]
MQTIILCGGTGTRLKEETEFKPKPMVKIGEKPLLWHIMKIYSYYGFNNFVIALGYKGEMIKEYFSNNNDDNFNLTMVDTGLESLTGERVRKLKEYIKDDIFMLTYGDGVADININKLLEFHKKQNTLATITGVHPRHKYGLVKIDGNNLVKEFYQKPTLPDVVNGGFMVFNKKVFDYIKKDSMIEDVFPPLISKKQLSVYQHNDFWFAVDTYKEYEDLNKMWQNNPQWKIWK